MPKRPKNFEEYSRSHQRKLKKLLLNNNLSSDDDEHSIQSFTQEEEISSDPSPVESQLLDNPTNRSDCEEDLLLGENTPIYFQPQTRERFVIEARYLSEHNESDGNLSDDLLILNHTSIGNASANDDTDVLEDCNSESENDHESIFQNHEPYERNRVNDYEPLYEGAPLSVLESMISILSLQVRHTISDTLLSDILGLIKLHCPAENKCISSLYKYKKYFSDIQTPIVRHYYCMLCSTRLESQESVCPVCTDDTKNQYFIEMPVLSQVRTLFKRHGFYRALQYRFSKLPQSAECLEDIYDGLAYKELFENDGILSNPVNFSMTWYTDGICIFKSSKFSIWPLYLIINELPFTERMKKENILLVALWFGDEKPVPNLFLEPLCPTFRELRQGIEVDIADLGYTLKTKGIVICGTCDLPAKALFLNMKQYNGLFGCQKCKQEGLYLRDARVQVYPFEDFQLRSDAETELHAQEALDRGIAVCGVKGPTILSAFVHQNMRAVAIDSMHCVFEGVVKSLLRFWFSPNRSNHPSSLLQYVDLVDERLKSFTPPSSVQRLARSIKKHLPYWKAHELKAWFFYYSIACINDIMVKVYFNHYKLLLLGVTLLSRSSISLHDLNIASRALREFVSMFEILYHKRNMTNNLHQLLHLVENVRQFGPLWTTSCFPLEDLNGKLKRLVHGSKSAQLQIHAAFSKFFNLGSLKNERLGEGSTAFIYCDKLEYKHGRLKRHFIGESVYIIGKFKQVSHHQRDIRRILKRLAINGAKLYSYNKLLKEKMLFSSADIQRSNERTNSNYALYTQQVNSTRIGRIRCFIRVSNCLCPGLCGCDADNYAIIRPCLVENEFSTCIDSTSLSMVNTLLGFEENETAINISNLRKVCFYLKVNDVVSQSYVIEPVNSEEFE